MGGHQRDHTLQARRHGLPGRAEPARQTNGQRQHDHAPARWPSARRQHRLLRLPVPGRGAGCGDCRQEGPRARSHRRRRHHGKYGAGRPGRDRGARGTHKRGQLRQHRTAVRRRAARQLHPCRHVPPLPRRALHARGPRRARGRHRYRLQPRPHGTHARGQASRHPLHRRFAHARGPGGAGRRALYRPGYPARAHPGRNGASISPRAKHRTDRHAGLGQDARG